MRNLPLSCSGWGDFEYDAGALHLEKGDELLLSSDGLHDKVPEDKIVLILKCQKDFHDKLRRLLDAALTMGG